MNNLIKKFSVLLLIVFVACSKNEEGDVYSSLGTEVDKARIEAASHSLFANIEELSDTKFAQLSVDLVEMMEDNANSSNKRVVHSIAELGVSMANEESICKHFEGIEGITKNGEESLTSLWQDGKGTWEWDAEINDFKRTSESEDEIIYKLPSSKESTSNDLILRIYDFEVYDGDFPGKGEELADGTLVTEMISSLFFEMKIEDELIATSNINVDISKSSGEIENVVMTFNPLPFSFQMEAVNAIDHSKWRYSFLNDSELVFEHLLYAEIAGSSQYMMIRKGQSSIQIKDIKMVANVEGNGFVTELALIETAGLTGKPWAQSMADAVNKHVDMKVRYVSDNAIIAQAIAFPSDAGMDGDWYVNFLLRFNDGSEISAEDFFEDDLAHLEIEFEDFLCDIEDRLK